MLRQLFDAAQLSMTKKSPAQAEAWTGMEGSQLRLNTNRLQQLRLCFLDRRRIPLARQCIGLRRVES